MFLPDTDMTDTLNQHTNPSKTSSPTTKFEPLTTPLDLDTICLSVVSLTPRPLDISCPLKRRLRGTHTPSERSTILSRNKPLHLAGIEQQSLWRSVRSLGITPPTNLPNKLNLIKIVQAVVRNDVEWVNQFRALHRTLTSLGTSQKHTGSQPPWLVYNFVTHCNFKGRNRKPP
jgi:hypothetical protein